MDLALIHVKYNVRMPTRRARKLNLFLTQIPWWYTMVVFIIIGYVTVGLRFATITAILLAFIGATGMWMHSMITLSSVLVSVLICFVIGVPLGVIASYNKWYRDIQNVVLDYIRLICRQNWISSSQILNPKTGVNRTVL